jgi:predicted dithiol-disulfide oxidoreductase (DUF899 family)
MNSKIEKLESQYADIAQKLAAARRGLEPEVIDKDYSFDTAPGTISLSELFGDHRALLLVHNMGKGCPYCTLWADGFNGVVQHLENATSFVVASPDSPKVQAEFAESRGWRFRMISYGASTFAADMGYEGADSTYGCFQPGVSAFIKQDDGKIARKGFTYFGPGDQFSGIWHMLDLIGKSTEDWGPKFSYK